MRVTGLTRIVSGSRAARQVRRRCAHNADHLAHDTPLSAFVTEVVCDLGATLPRGATSPTVNGGIAPLEARHAEGRLLMLQNPHHYPRRHAPSPVQDYPPGRHTAPRRDLTDSKRGNCTIRGTTRRRHAEGRLLMLQNPPTSPECGGVAEVNCVPESPASQNIWAITPMPAIVRRGGLHCGRHIPANSDLTTPNRGLTATKRGELHH